MSRLFDTVLVANRGEIAVRIMRTLRDLGIRSVAVYSDADAAALHARSADIAVRIGPAPARESYLSVDAVIRAAVETGAQAIHPGYGFLSENPALARACAEHGIVFIGPPPEAIEAMGDKIAAKATVATAGVSVVPGSDGAGLDDDALAAAAAEVGYPVLLKPSAGGGGKGMRLVDLPDDLPDAIASARREARNSFGDDTLLLERFVTNPRHIEIQILADTHGNVVHLGERECSLQRRHQKIIEEAPSPLLTPEWRAAMGQQAVDAARACGYVGAGTVEFIVSADRPAEFFFMEMNTRLQVEHPVTEWVHRLDLVEQQIRVAAGEALSFQQDDLAMHGHAIEARVYAEDPSRGFLPTGGEIVRFRAPFGQGVRVDSGVADGSVVGSDYDPMLAKVICWGDDRSEALHRLDGALAATAVLGVTTNIGFLRRLLADADVRAGRLDTGLVERRLDELVEPSSPEIALVVTALSTLADRGVDAWSALVGWRHGRPAPTRIAFDVGGVGRANVAVTDDVDGTVVAVDDGPMRRCSFEHDARQGRVTIDGIVHPVTHVMIGSTSHVAVGGVSWTIERVVPRGVAESATGGAGDGVVRSPMPGTVIAVHVAVGDEVAAGEVVAIVEAMKMEHALRAPSDGVVAEVTVTPGAAVSLDQPLLRVDRSSHPD
ncbi:MAG TPA: acetyl/propionyl/methylcrotonyl-CoA carboxylase subunit alpha [Ilumatobacter sp.]|nr:acetyl/propionyl/methylcrotonyl-CoA carboxylase subunit alpha [Ilumatobacter sp.]